MSYKSKTALLLLHVCSLHHYILSCLRHSQHVPLIACFWEIGDLNLFLFNTVPWLWGIVRQCVPAVLVPFCLHLCMQIDTRGIYQLQVHCTESHAKSGGNLWLATNRVRERFRGSVKINQHNEEISDLLASQSFPSLRLIFMSIHHGWSGQHCGSRFMERGLSPCSNYLLPLNVLMFKH